MFDDFRDAGEFLEEETSDELQAEAAARTADNDLLFGMTPVQRFVLAVLFFLSMCLVGTFCLLVTDKIALPLY